MIKMICPRRYNKINLKETVNKKNSYFSWLLLMSRCYNEKNDRYKDYGARGISVCKRWHDFNNFYNDMGDRKKGLTIERINNDDGYYKENCKWATFKEQANNRRGWKNNKRWKIKREKKQIEKLKKLKERMIVCIQTGKHFANQSRAAEYFSISRERIRQCLIKGKIKNKYSFVLLKNLL